MSRPNEEGLYTLSNRQGMRVLVSARGATLVSWLTPDSGGRMADVLLGYPDRSGYQDNSTAYFGALVGRWANRIDGARFTLDGVDYQLDPNDRGNHLHGGGTGFHQAEWTARQDDAGLSLTLESPAGEGGYPGTLKVAVRYELNDDGALSIVYEASTDAPTPVNLTSHPYFNLNGGASDIGDHLLSIAADDYLPIDSTGIPLGVEPVDGTPFDFRQPAAIGPRLRLDEQLKNKQMKDALGFDHCYSLRGGRSAEPREVARVFDPATRRTLTVSTTEPGLQFYSGNYLEGVIGRRPEPYAIHDGFCLEAQAFPDQVNGPDAEAVILRPGQVYRQTTIYRLGV
ncbi:aldose epimerase family protein [Rugamonas sp.]|uniref:aldose epimerase family protein n=1 Tax=Rugamonas sp. TaxID=1926287 RepID=UPI0025EAA514|nr:aldose epimerase family protein [Rugamonas sp.]